MCPSNFEATNNKQYATTVLKQIKKSWEPCLSESAFSEVPPSLRDTERAGGVLSDKRGVRIYPEVKEHLASQKGTKTKAMEARGAKRISKCAPGEQIRKSSEKGEGAPATRFRNSCCSNHDKNTYMLKTVESSIAKKHSHLR